MPHNADIDKRAKELEPFFFQTHGRAEVGKQTIPVYFITGSLEALAKHVESLLIDRAIEELEGMLSEYARGNEYAQPCESDQMVLHRIDELRQQKESL